WQSRPGLFSRLRRFQYHRRWFSPTDRSFRIRCYHLRRMSEPAIESTSIEARGNRASRRRGHTLGRVGAVILVLVAGACIGKLPYAPGRESMQSNSGGVAPRRYEATRPEAALLPPFWAPQAQDERDRARNLHDTAGH